jgi:hypothetical protein
LNSSRSLSRSLPILALALWCLIPWGTARAGSASYVVDVDTSGLSGTAGYLDFQFNPAAGDSLSAAASVTGYSGGSAFSVFFQNGDASGTLPGDLSFDNGTPLNELTFGLTYGTTITYDVTLSGAAVGGSAPDGSTFAFTLYDANGNSYADGPATVTITINPDGSTTGTAYPSIGGGYSGASVSPAGAVPEPSTLALGGLGLATLSGWVRLRRRPAA